MCEVVDLRLQEMSSDEEAAEVAATGAKNELEEYAYRLKGSLDQLQSEVIRILSWLEQGTNPTSKEGYEVAKLHLQENVKYVSACSVVGD